MVPSTRLPLPSRKKITNGISIRQMVTASKLISEVRETPIIELFTAST